MKKNYRGTCFCNFFLHTFAPMKNILDIKLKKTFPSEDLVYMLLRLNNTREEILDVLQYNAVTKNQMRQLTKLSGAYIHLRIQSGALDIITPFNYIPVKTKHVRTKKKVSGPELILVNKKFEEIVKEKIFGKL